MLAKLIKYLLGFSFVGAFCTLLTVILNYLFLKVLETPLYVTYFAVYILTILVSYYLNSRMVFKAGKSTLNLILYYAVYGSGMIFGFFVLKFYEKNLEFENHILTYLVIPVTTLWNFGMSSFLFKWKKMKAAFTRVYQSITAFLKKVQGVFTTERIRS
jgi:putative flippase GtrA